MKNLFKTTILLSGIWALLIAPAAHAGYYNFGTLDVKPVHIEQSQNPDWFVEYLKPGEQKQQQIQISNFSSKNKDLTVYTTDTATNENNQYFAKTITETSDDIKSWITLPTTSLELKAGESKILSVNFDLPKNAGVGLHTGAIIVRENKTNTSMPLENMAIEKGVRVYLNVTGTAISKGNISNISSSQSLSKYNVNIQTINEGTVDIVTPYKVELRDFFGNLIYQEQQESRTKPQTTKTTTISTEKPSFGLYQVSLTNGENISHFENIIVIPFWAVFLALGLILAYSRVQSKQSKFNKQSFNWNTTKLNFKSSFSTIAFQRSVAYIAIVSIFSASTFAYTNLNFANAAHNDDDAQSISSYQLTVKWGKFRNIFMPGTHKKEWHGKLEFRNAQIKISKLLHFEKSDKAEIVKNKRTLNFDAITGPDNDGLVLDVTPIGNKVPIIIFTNNTDDTKYEFEITKFLNSDGIFPEGLNATYFKTELGKQDEKRLKALEQVKLLDESDATIEIEATPEPKAQIPELENLFVEELPATPEVLTEFILASDYVEEVVEENEVSQIETDEILMEALEATPDVLEEIAGTPELNFIFVPSESVNFPPIQFSFDRDTVVTQDLGTLIFVQNKETPWNTYIETTDFDLLSGNYLLPASYLTIIPGEPTLLSEKDGAKITSGETKKFKNDKDKTSLVNVKPTKGNQEIFVLNPKLEIRIPKGTPAGTYQGELTITSL